MNRITQQGRYVALALALLAQVAVAVTSGLTELPVVATDGQTYGARFAIGMTADGGKSWQSSANLNQHITIKGSIDPAPAHVGVKADIFVVELYNNQWTMLTSSGTWLPWSTRVAELQPMQEDVTLAATQEFTIHDGGIATAGEHRVFIDNRAAGVIDQYCSILGELQEILLSDISTGVLVERHVDRDKIGIGQGLLAGTGQSHFRGQVVDVIKSRKGIETKDAHAMMQPGIGHPNTDLAQAKDSQGLP